ncbi:MAG: hypothetical protein JOY87_03905 [Candidatus Eremiobacteraeota bacterium]|nr:hypothetical protein [Candidatus Eremiobacteraeota bacterium]MBV8670398.1 hypothetical protein [Candidatus Eremiobacteraeota bacterium]
MKIAVSYDDSGNSQLFRAGDTVRRRDNNDSCVVIWTWDGWLWLDPVELFSKAPFTARADDCDLVRRGMS